MGGHLGLTPHSTVKEPWRKAEEEERGKAEERINMAGVTKQDANVRREKEANNWKEITHYTEHCAERLRLLNLKVTLYF